MRQDAFNLGTWGRIPVSLHWTALLGFAWLYIIFWDVVATLIGAVALFALFVAHEYGHVFVLRRKRIAVSSIQFFGLHGETAYNEYAAKRGDDVAIAWGGVAAQLVVLGVALAAAYLVPFDRLWAANVWWPPIATILIKFNIFLMIVALLPIGPFDGHAAWKGLSGLRKKARKPKARPAPPRAPEPETLLSDEERRAYDERAQEEAGKLIARLSGKEAPRTDRRE